MAALPAPEPLLDAAPLVKSEAVKAVASVAAPPAKAEPAQVAAESPAKDVDEVELEVDLGVKAKIEREVEDVGTREIKSG